MARRKPIDAGIEVRAEQAARQTHELERRKTAVSSTDKVTTAMYIPRATWVLLRAVAFKRAQETGDRPSVSALVGELVERHREELEDEIGGVQ